MTTGHDLGEWMCMIRNVPVWTLSEHVQRDRKMLLGEVKVMCGRREQYIFLERFFCFLPF